VSVSQKPGSSRRAGLCSRFMRDDRGVALVEFAIVLPVMLLLFAVIIESGRMLKSYQAANAGVRDATRYLARIVRPDVCSAGGGAVLAGYEAQLATIISENIQAGSVFAPLIALDTTTPVVTRLQCNIGGPGPFAEVSANLVINFPFSGVFSLVGGSLSTFTASVSDQARIYGL
jgi:Flp pilus assembly protein TadG